VHTSRPNWHAYYGCKNHECKTIFTAGVNTFLGAGILSIGTHTKVVQNHRCKTIFTTGVNTFLGAGNFINYTV
jgi:hypothetical protein